MYVREYSSGVTEKDTMQLFGEYMIVYYYPLQTKVKGNKKGDAYPSVRALNSCLRLAKASSRDTIMRITDVVNDYDLLSIIPLQDLR